MNDYSAVLIANSRAHIYLNAKLSVNNHLINLKFSYIENEINTIRHDTPTLDVSSVTMTTPKLRWAWSYILINN